MHNCTYIKIKDLYFKFKFTLFNMIIQLYQFNTVNTVFRKPVNQLLQRFLPDQIFFFNGCIKLLKGKSEKLFNDL